MDIERICANLRVLPSAEELMEAERALEALEAENEKLRAELGRLQEIKDILGPDYDLDRAPGADGGGPGRPGPHCQAAASGE